jgi:hypothetical protein
MDIFHFVSVGCVVASLLILVLVVRDICWFGRFPKLNSKGALLAQPFVSIVIPARNEQHNIAQCLESALVQTYAHYEIILVDDGSTDDTPHILARYAQRFPDRLRVVSGRPLPTGWVGKCNACLHGAQQANPSSAWLLFIDADTVAQPSLLAALIAHAQDHRLDVLTAFPFNDLPTVPERLVLPVFFQFAFTAFPAQKIATPEPPPELSMANGQCLLVSADAYWALGGHAAVKDKVLEDVEFAQAFRRAGYRLAVTTAFSEMRVRMYHTLAEITQGLGKHAVAGRRASGPRAFWSVLRVSLTLLAPPLVCVCAAMGVLATNGTQPIAWLALGMAAPAYGTALWFWAQRYRDWYALPGRYAFLAPIGWLIYLLIVARSTFAVLFRRGVRWKGRVYS